ncbi:hypothetical protein LDENG_00210360 [Lucifuga dentata]|nr:hypothetical protein LDENG_00210360 [Lucifuga dentata]
MLPGLLFWWPAHWLQWYTWVTFLDPGLICCPGSPLSPRGSASWVSFHLGCATWPCGFCRAWSYPCFGKILCLGPGPTHQLQL